MKSGRHRQAYWFTMQSGRGQQARYLEYISRENQYIEADIRKLSNGDGPYFSLFLVSRNG